VMLSVTAAFAANGTAESNKATTNFFMQLTFA
jgi:hypothetical protein